MRVTRTHYEKIICACCFLLLFMNIGFASTSFNAYQPYIVAAVGHEAGSNVLLIRTLVSLLGIMVVGKWYEKLNCRLGTFIAGLLTSAGFFAYGFATSFPGYCVGAVLTGMGYGLGSMVAVTLLIGRWYKTRVGTAVGIAATGSSFAGIIMPIVSTFLIENASLSWSFRFEAVLSLIISCVVFALLRNDPADLSLQPFSDEEALSENVDGKRKARTNRLQQRGMTVSLSSTARRVLWFAMFLMGCVAIDGWNYLSVLMRFSGFETYFVATLLSVGATAMVLGKIATGSLFDRIGTLRGSILFFGILIAGLGLCALADLGSSAVMVAAVLLTGFGISLGTVGISVWSLDLSTLEDRPKLVKDLQVAYAFGGFIFNLLPGRIVEAGGSYTVSYAILALICIAEAIIVIGIYRRQKA